MDIPKAIRRHIFQNSKLSIYLFTIKIYESVAYSLGILNVRIYKQNKIIILNYLRRKISLLVVIDLDVYKTTK